MENCWSLACNRWQSVRFHFIKLLSLFEAIWSKSIYSHIRWFLDNLFWCWNSFLIINRINYITLNYSNWTITTSIIIFNFHKFNWRMCISLVVCCLINSITKKQHITDTIKYKIPVLNDYQIETKKIKLNVTVKHFNVS